MALSKEVYSAFENIVGAEYISNDPAMMPAYHQVQFAAIILPKAQPSLFDIIEAENTRPVALLPVFHSE